MRTVPTTAAKKQSVLGSSKINLTGFDKRTSSYIDTIPFAIKGIPCLIGVVDYFSQPHHKGSPMTCWSDLDYYGYEEIDYVILDRKGYKADWLAKKIDVYIDSEINELISKEMNKT